jgi:geranylgeranyl diphosphate synthase type II
MVHSAPVTTMPSRATGDLPESWHALRQRYAELLVDRLGLQGPLEAVATHALQGGKRLRPVLAEVLGRALGAPHVAVTAVALAIEYLHTASMMLDDLPCMDDATERRGAMAAHIRFSEAEVILAALALVSRSYAILLTAPVREAGSMVLLATETVASAMALGQAAEFAPETKLSQEAIERIHDQKTASLFGLLGRLIAMCAEATLEVTAQVVTFMTLLGRAYQIIDDIEDRDEPGEMRGNVVLVVDVGEAMSGARERLSAARRAIADVDVAGELGAFVEWLEGRLDVSSR